MQLMTYALEQQTHTHMAQRLAEATHERARLSLPRTPGIRAKIASALQRLRKSRVVFAPCPACY